MSLFIFSSFAQDKTTVSATNSEISDNLDLRAIASIFGDSKDLEDFENRLNDPKNQISNLDLNNDNQVDYLRVIESVEGNTHLVVIQSVLEKDTYQDVATVEVEKDANNQVQVQVVGDVYMYGNNYIYEPVYVSIPIIYNYFWTPHYRPYYSRWYWNYYPSYFTYWTPFPIFRYRSHIGLYINFNHHYNYVNHRRCQVAYNNYYNRRANYYERQYPNRSFNNRNSGYRNRYELDKTREIRTVGSPRNRSIKNGVRNEDTRNNENKSPRTNSIRTKEISTRDRSTKNTEVRAPRSKTKSESPRVKSSSRNTSIQNRNSKSSSRSSKSGGRNENSSRR